MSLAVFIDESSKFAIDRVSMFFLSVNEVATNRDPKHRVVAKFIVGVLLKDVRSSCTKVEVLRNDLRDEINSNKSISNDVDFPFKNRSDYLLDDCSNELSITQLI
jgi:hypothetical protein